MAKRTYRRPVSYSELSTKQLNSLAGNDQYMASFSGLNTGKNYTTIDQNSFSDCKNMFIDTDERLSTRPPIKTSKNEKYSSIHIVSYKSINGVNFFVIDDGTTKLVSDLGYNDSLIELGNITESGKLFFVNGKYIVFDVNSIWGFSIDHSNKTYKSYTESDLIYVPTSLDLNPRNDKEIAKNIFTPDTFQQIVYTQSNVNGETNPPDDGAFVSKDVVVHMNGKDYKKKWSSNQWRTFVYELYNGEILDKVTNIEFSKDGRHVVAFTPKDIGDKKFSEGFYYSENGGKSFTLIENPCNNTDLGRTISLSEDGKGLLYVGYTGSKLGSLNTYVAYAEFPIDGVNFSWSSYPDTPSNVTFNAFTRNTSQKDQNPYCYVVQDYRPALSNIVAYCINRNNFVICFGCVKGDTFSFTTHYTSNASSASGETDSYSYENALPLTLHAYINSKWYYAIHYPVNSMVSDVQVYNAYLIPNKSRIRLTIDENGNGVIVIGYFVDSLNNLATELVRIYFGNDTGFVPGIFEGTDQDGYFCGIVTTLNNIPVLGQKKNEQLVLDDNWMDSIGTLNNNEYDSLLLITSSLSARVYNITTYETKSDHDNVTNLSNTTEQKRKSPYYVFNSSEKESQFEKYSVDSDGNMVVISLGTILTQNFLRSTKEGILNREADIELFDSEVRPLYVDNNGNFIYLYDGSLYKNGIADNEEVTVTVDKGPATYNYLIPDFVNEIVTNNFTFVFGDSVYQSYYGDGKLYVPEYTKDTLEGEITNVIRFSDVSLGLFLENIVYEYQYSSDLTSQTAIPSFARHPTKLQLGCLKGSDVVHTYDGASIIMTTKKGVAVLNYQQFVQSTEQVYTFLSNNIDDYYESWSNKYTKPIKIVLFKDYILFYQINNPVILLFDTRNQSWWPWELPTEFKIINNIDNELSLVPSNSKVFGLKSFDFSDKISYKDYDDSLIRWKFETQPLHFQSPNFYKHISRFSIVANDTPSRMIFDLRFNIYQNLNNISEYEVLFHKIDMLTTIIERINFMKLNALKIICSSNDEYTDSPFITSAIIIHYRPTEVIR